MCKRKTLGWCAAPQPRNAKHTSSSGWPNLAVESHEYVRFGASIDRGERSERLLAPPCVRFRGQNNPIWTSALSTAGQFCNMAGADADLPLPVVIFTERSTCEQLTVIARLSVGIEKVLNALKGLSRLFIPHVLHHIIRLVGFRTSPARG